MQLILLERRIFQGSERGMTSDKFLDRVSCWCIRYCPHGTSCGLKKKDFMANPDVISTISTSLQAEVCLHQSFAWLFTSMLAHHSQDYDSHSSNWTYDSSHSSTADAHTLLNLIHDPPRLWARRTVSARWTCRANAVMGESSMETCARMLSRGMPNLSITQCKRKMVTML